MCVEKRSRGMLICPTLLVEVEDAYLNMEVLSTLTSLVWGGGQETHMRSLVLPSTDVQHLHEWLPKSGSCLREREQVSFYSCSFFLAFKFANGSPEEFRS